MNKFKNFNLKQELINYLQLNNYDTPLKVQEEVIPLLLKNEDLLVQAKTGERVIIVMGAVNVMKPRVSGTLNKYILCIA